MNTAVTGNIMMVHVDMVTDITESMVAVMAADMDMVVGMEDGSIPEEGSKRSEIRSI
jgi:hypothetical protein